MDEDTKTTFEGWAIVELFGHNQIAGYVTEAAQFGTSMMRVDIPEIGNNPGYTKFFGGAAIYAITPTTEEIARIAVIRLDIRPVSTWIVPENRPQLPQNVPVDEYPEDYEDDDIDSVWSGDDE
jgi:hypothetical protein